MNDPGKNLKINLFTATCGFKDQRQEKPLDGEQDEEGVAEVAPLPVDPPQQKVESRTSVSQLPQDGQETWSLSSLRMHRYSKTLSQLLHLNS